MKKKYHTTTLIAALLALALAACDAATEGNDMPAAGMPLTLEDVRVGTATRTATPIEGEFSEGETLTATVSAQGTQSTGDYQYKDNAWTSISAAYWQAPDAEHEVSLKTSDRHSFASYGDMPDAFTADNWHQYDYLSYEGATRPTTSFTLQHNHAQLCVTLQPGDGMAEGDLAGATVKVGETGLWHPDNGAYYALLPAGSGQPLPLLTIALGSDTYAYRPEEDILPRPNQCLQLTLRVNRADVEGLRATCDDWQPVTATTTEDTEATMLHCATPGSLNVPPNLSGKVFVTGTINNQDLDELNDWCNNVTHLYILAQSDGPDGLAIPPYFCEHNNNILELSIPEATSIGEYAFYDSRQLTTLRLPQVRTIGSSTFNGSRQLTTLVLPQVQTIGSYAFQGSQPTAVALPSTVEVDHMYTASNPTLFLTDEGTTYATAEACWELGGGNWGTIYYGYHGAAGGDYLDPANYDGKWPP